MPIDLTAFRRGERKRVHGDILLDRDPQVIQAPVDLHGHHILGNPLTQCLQKF
jgi:hypothetical protein